MTDLVTLQSRLAEAETALHALMTGTTAVSVATDGGESVSYARAEAGSLRAYIQDLKRLIDAAEGTTTNRRKAFRPYF